MTRKIRIKRRRTLKGGGSFEIRMINTFEKNTGINTNRYIGLILRPGGFFGYLRVLIPDMSKKHIGRINKNHSDDFTKLVIDFNKVDIFYNFFKKFIQENETTKLQEVDNAYLYLISCIYKICNILTEFLDLLTQMNKESKKPPVFPEYQKILTDYKRVFLEDGFYNMTKKDKTNFEGDTETMVKIYESWEKGCNDLGIAVPIN